MFVGDVVDPVPIAKLLATDGEGMEVAVMPLLLTPSLGRVFGFKSAAYANSEPLPR